MSAGVKTKNFPKAISLFEAGLLPYEETLEVAIKRSLNILRDNARILLKAYVYDKPGRSAWEEDLTGRLYKSFRIAVLDVSGGRAVGELRNTAPEATWVEHGVAPHQISAKNAQAMRWHDALGEVYAKTVNHPGYHGVEFMKEALAMSRAEILQVFETAFKARAVGKQIPFSLSSDLYEEDDGETIGNHMLA